jgi:hypothetical protein
MIPTPVNILRSVLVVVFAWQASFPPAPHPKHTDGGLIVPLYKRPMPDPNPFGLQPFGYQRKK